MRERGGEEERKRGGEGARGWGDGEIRRPSFCRCIAVLSFGSWFLVLEFWVFLLISCIGYEISASTCFIPLNSKLPHYKNGHIVILFGRPNKIGDVLQNGFNDFLRIILSPAAASVMISLSLFHLNT